MQVALLILGKENSTHLRATDSPYSTADMYEASVTLASAEIAGVRPGATISKSAKPGVVPLVSLAYTQDPRRSAYV